MKSIKDSVIMFTALFCLLISSVTSADDIAYISIETLMNFDIEGVKLGDSIKVAKNAFPKGKISKDTMSPIQTYTYWDKISGQYNSYTVNTFGQDARIFRIIHDQKLGALDSDSFNAEINKILSKYGKPSNSKVDSKRKRAFIVWTTRGAGQLVANLKKRIEALGSESFIIKLSLELQDRSILQK